MAIFSHECVHFDSDFRSATYGRMGGSTKQVCSGQRNTGPAEDCYFSDQGVVDQVRGPCQGQMSCSVPVGGHMADLSSGCNTNIKELNVTYSCGKNYFIFTLFWTGKMKQYNFK